MESEEFSFAGDEDFPPEFDLDESGFPVSPPASGDGDGGRERNSTFALDFYGGGTDWSSLVEEKEKKSLVQRDLFHMWGIKRPEAEPKPRVSQRDLFEMWGIKKPEKESRPRVLSPPRKRHRVEAGGASTDDGASSKFDRGKSNRPRVCPFYKKIPGTPFTVDAFSYGSVEGCSAYFLTHFHCDHYGGLKKSWSHGRIYCSPLTARLVKMCLGVNSLYICPLEFGEEHVIEGIKVTLLEANHCPGAALIHLRLRDGLCYLHTGDFRASKQMQLYPLLVNHHINVLYLDTTYCNPKYRFPPKEEVVNFVVRITQNFLAKQPKALIVVGAYSIGKEQVYLAISRALGLPIFTNTSRRRILQSFCWPELAGKLCSHGESSSLHVLPLSFLRLENLEEYVRTYKKQFTAVLAFRPTGWTYSEKTGHELALIKPTSKRNVTIYGVPYSEHSSFTELREFVEFLRPDKIIPTVNIGNAINREKMQTHFREWLKA